MDISSKVFEKTQNVLFFDKIKTPKEMINIVASEVFYVLKQYFEINPSDYDARIQVSKNGEMNIDFSFKASRILLKKEPQV